MSRMVLLNKEDVLVAKGITFRELASSLQAKGLVNIDVDGRFWEWQNPERKLEYTKREEEDRPGSGYTRESFVVEASYDIVQHVCKKLGYSLYEHDVHM